jgi:hypothetical protein
MIYLNKSPTSLDTKEQRALDKLKGPTKSQIQMVELQIRKM